MYVLKPYELFELLKQAVPQPNLTIENIAKLLYLYRESNLPVKESTAYMNKVLSKIGVQAKGNRCLRGELCICFVHMKMCNRQNAPLGVDELCERYDLERVEVERDPYFRSFCYYLCPVLDIVEPVKHSEFIIQNILVPLSGAHGIKYISGSKEAPRTRIRYKAFEIESHWFRPKTLSMIDGIEPRPSPQPTDGGLIMKRSIQFIADPALKIRLKSNKKVSDQSLPLSSGSLRVGKTDNITGTGNTTSTTDTNMVSSTTTDTTTTTTTTTASHNLNAYKPYLVQDSAVELSKGRRQASCPRPRKRKRPLTDSQNPDFGQPSSNSNNSNSSTMYANHEIFSNPYQKKEFKQPLCYTNNYETYVPVHNRAQYVPDPQYVHNQTQYVPDPQYVHNQTQYVPDPRVQYVPDPQYVLDSQPGPQYVQNTSSTSGIHFVTPEYSQENSQEQCSQEYSEESQCNHHSALPLPHPTQQQQQQQYNMMSCNHYIEEGDYSSHYMQETGYNKPSFYPSYDGFIAIPLSESNYPTGRYAPSAALSMGNEVYRRSVYMPSDHALPPPQSVLPSPPLEHDGDELMQACTEALVKIGYNMKSLHVGV